MTIAEPPRENENENETGLTSGFGAMDIKDKTNGANGHDDGWGGFGDTAAPPPAPATKDTMAIAATTGDDDGWGGFGDQPAPQPAKDTPAATTGGDDGWGGFGDQPPVQGTSGIDSWD